LDLYTASRIHRDFADATIQLDLVTERLTDIETTIGAEVVERLQADSKRRGGEQYRPDDAKISCKWYWHTIVRRADEI